MVPVRGFASCLSAVLLFSSTALADDKDRARELAREAGDLLDGKRYEEALDRARQAETLYHAPSHLLMAAEALKALGRLAEAMDAYERLVAEPLPSSAPPLFLKAQETGRNALRELAARTPSVLVRVSGAPRDRVKALLDGHPIDLAMGVAVRTDPGAHRIDVAGEGFAPVSRTVSLPPKGGIVVVDVALAPAGAANDVPSEPAALEPPQLPPVPPREKGSLVPGIVTISLGGAAAVAGAITGAMSISQTSALKSRCPQNRCMPGDQTALDSAGRLATTSDVTFGIAGAGVVVGVILLIVRPGGAPAPRASARVTPWIGAGSAGLEGAF
jgi:hypothetical protein